MILNKHHTFTKIVAAPIQIIKLIKTHDKTLGSASISVSASDSGSSYCISTSKKLPSIVVSEESKDHKEEKR